MAEAYDADGVRLNEGGGVLRGRQAIAKDVRALLERVGPVKVTWRRQADGGWKIKSDLGVPGT